MKKFLFLTLSLMLVATGAWAIKGKVDTTTKAAKYQVVDKANDNTKLMPLRDRTARFAAPEGAVTLPYTNTFDTEEELAGLGVYDANNDSCTWGLSQATGGGYMLAYSYSSANAADDYLFLPPMELNANSSYSFALEAWCRSSYYPERFEVLLMSVDDDEADLISVIPSTDVTSTTATTFSNEAVTVPTTGYYEFVIHAISDADKYMLYVDNVSVNINAEKELIMSLSAPATVNAGQTVNVAATVLNGGSAAAQNYTVTVTMGEEVLANETVAEELAPGAKKEFAFEIPTNAFDAGKELTFNAEVEFDGDALPDNNSATATVTINANDLDAPLNLTAEGNEDGTIVANWEVPEPPEVYTEDFENIAIFPAFTNGGIDEDVHTGAFGDWTLYDGNGITVYGYSSVDVPNLGGPQAWFVMAPGSDQLSQSLMSTQAPHSGDQLLASFCPADNSGAPAADHWLISPELTGEAQTISFFARELTDQYGAETFEVLASTSDNDPANFTLVESSVSCEVTTWTEYSFDLPAGTKYFAIRHTSEDIFALFIDDVTFKPAAPPAGTVPDAFNVYLDGELVETVAGNVFTYTFEDVEPGDYLVQVTAVYGELESEPAEAEATVPEVVVEKFAINVTQIGEGTIDCPEEAAPGETVTFTIDAGENTYELSITDATGAPIDYQPLHTGVDTYSFVMPNGPVNINVTFTEAPITGVNDINAGKTIANVRYYNMAGQRVAQANGATIVVTTYTDGTTRTVKMMK